MFATAALGSGLGGAVGAQPATLAQPKERVILTAGGQIGVRATRGAGRS